VSELPSSEDLDPSTGTDAPTPPTTTGPSSYTLNWEEPTYLGTVVIRRQLTPELARVGGHIGYHVVPSLRRRGHAGRMLAGALVSARTSMCAECC